VQSSEGLLQSLSQGDWGRDDMAVSFVAKGFQESRDTGLKEAQKLERKRIFEREVALIWTGGNIGG
jgi:hypothetical protein